MSSPPRPRPELPVYGAEPETSHPIPLAFLGAGQAWFLAGALGLVFVAPDLAAGNLFSPRVIAVTHTFTLGVITSAVFGASHQFVPAVMGVVIRDWRIARLGFWVFHLGVATLVTSLWRWSPQGQAVGWVLLLLGVGFASWNTLPARRRARRHRLVGTSLSVGHSALGLAMIVAAVRIGQGLGWWPAGRDALLAAHFHLGVIGFGSLTIAGMGSRMLPAFFDATPAREHQLRLFQAVAGGGVAIHVTGLLAGWHGLTVIGGIVMAIAVVMHLHMLAAYIRTRRARLDPGLGIILLAVTCYAIALGLGLWLLARDIRGGTMWAGYALFAIVGWLSLMTVGVSMRIVPRIVTLLGVARGVRPEHGPAVQWSATVWPWGAVALLGGGVLGMGIGIVQGHGATTTVAAGVFAAGAVLTTAGWLPWFRPENYRPGFGGSAER